MTRTETVTEPAQTRTITSTTQAPSGTTSIRNQTTTVQVHAPPSTSESSGIPAWAWVLIALGVIGIVLGVIAFARSHGSAGPKDGPGGPGQARL